jgi:hypothetical protein
LEGGCAAYDFDSFERLCRRRVVAFWIAKRVSADVVAVLTGIKIRGAIRVKAACADAKLQAGAIAFPDIEASDAFVDFAGIVGGEIGLYVGELDDFRFFLPA